MDLDLAKQSTGFEKQLCDLHPAGAVSARNLKDKTRRNQKRKTLRKRITLFQWIFWISDFCSPDLSI